MRRAIWLAVLVTLPALATAQTAQTDNKRSTKSRPSLASPKSDESSTRQPAKPSASSPALDRTRSEQSDDADETPAMPAEPSFTERMRAVIDNSESEESDDDGPALPLSVRLFLTHNPGGFQKAWSAGAPSLPTTKTIGQANPVMAMVTVSGCKRGKDGKCSLLFTSRTAGPDGLFDKPSTTPAWKPIAIRGKPELAPASFALKLGPGDPPGRYTIEVKVTDTVAGTSRVVTGVANKPSAAGGR